MSNGEELSLLPCPFCGGTAEWYDITEADEVGNAGGSCIICTKCQACGPVQFGEKDTIVDQWNRRSSPSAVEAAEVMGPTYYTEGKDAEWFEALDNAEFAKRLSFAAMDIVDGDFSSIENYMPIVAMLSSAADRLGAAKLATDTEVERTWVFDPSGLWISTVQSDAYSFVELTKQKASDRDVTLTIHRGDEDTARWTDLSIELHEHNAKRLAALLCASPPPASPSAPQGVDVGPVIAQITALLELDATGKLVPHGIGGLARELLTTCRGILSAIQTSPEAGR